MAGQRGGGADRRAQPQTERGRLAHRRRRVVEG
jgi:hypothetical protein